MLELLAERGQSYADLDDLLGPRRGRGPPARPCRAGRARRRRPRPQRRPHRLPAGPGGPDRPGRRGPPPAPGRRRPRAGGRDLGAASPSWRPRAELPKLPPPPGGGRFLSRERRRCRAERASAGRRWPASRASGAASTPCSAGAAVLLVGVVLAVAASSRATESPAALSRRTDGTATAATTSARSRTVRSSAHPADAPVGGSDAAGAAIVGILRGDQSGRRHRPGLPRRDRREPEPGATGARPTSSGSCSTTRPATRCRRSSPTRTARSTTGSRSRRRRRARSREHRAIEISLSERRTRRCGDPAGGPGPDLPDQAARAGPSCAGDIRQPQTRRPVRRGALGQELAGVHDPGRVEALLQRPQRLDARRSPTSACM